MRFFSSPFFSFFGSFRVISIVNGRVEKPLWYPPPQTRLGSCFYEKRYIYTRLGGIHYNSLDRRKTKGTTFPNRKLRDWSEGEPVTLAPDVDDRGRSRPKGARREEQAIDRKTSDRLAVRPSQLDRQAGPDVGEEVWRRRRPWRSPRKRRRVSETLSGRDRCPPPPHPARSRPRLRKVAPIVTMPGSARSRHLG